MEKEKLERISHLSRKERTIGLDEEVKKEKTALRRDYLEAIRKSLVGTLENTYVVDEKGNKRKIHRRF